MTIDIPKRKVTPRWIVTHLLASVFGGVVFLSAVVFLPRFSPSMLQVGIGLGLSWAVGFFLYQLTSAPIPHFIVNVSASLAFYIGSVRLILELVESEKFFLVLAIILYAFALISPLLNCAIVNGIVEELEAPRTRFFKLFTALLFFLPGLSVYSSEKIREGNIFATLFFSSIGIFLMLLWAQFSAYHLLEAYKIGTDDTGP